MPIRKTNKEVSVQRMQDLYMDDGRGGISDRRMLNLKPPVARKWLRQRV